MGVEELKQLEEDCPVTNDIHESAADELVIPINEPKSKNVSCCGGKGSSLASLYELSTLVAASKDRWPFGKGNPEIFFSAE